VTPLRLHNTMSGRLEQFVPIEPGHVRMYTCGPTVHDYSHIGNFRTFLFEDLLRRVLLQQGYRVTQVMNLTDVEDRIIKKSAERGQTIDEFTEPYIEAFFQDLDTLRIQRAEHYPRATQHIFEMVSLIERLTENGHTYVADGSTYFRISSFPRYGALAHLDVSGLKAGARVDVDEYGKDDPRDFVLWKARKPGEQSWETPLGTGRPGWHIECSAMSMQYLGETLDIHAGGVDLIFPHHEDEIAQSEGATGKTFARYWLHAQHLQDATGEKMSKRLRNFSTVRDLLAEGYTPRAIRYALLTGAHYRSPLAFSPELLKAADSAVRRLDEFAVRLGPSPYPDPPPGGGREIDEVRQRWDEALLTLHEQGWQLTFDDVTYPLALRPDWAVPVDTPAHLRQLPADYWRRLLAATLTCTPPEPIPALFTAVAEADRPASRAATRPTLPPRALPPLPPPLTGSQVRQARLAKGWSQQELARRVGKSQPWVALVEQEKRTMQPQEQAALRVLMDLEPASSS